MINVIFLLPAHWDSITWGTGKVPVKLKHMVTINNRNTYSRQKKIISQELHIAKCFSQHLSRTGSLEHTFYKGNQSTLKFPKQWCFYSLFWLDLWASCIYSFHCCFLPSVPYYFRRHHVAEQLSKKNWNVSFVQTLAGVRLSCYQIKSLQKSLWFSSCLLSLVVEHCYCDG